jgi:hypothetical protein
VAASPPLVLQLLERLEEVDLGAHVALEVAGVEHASAADGEVHAARQQLAGGAPPDLVRHRGRHPQRRGCTPRPNKQSTTKLACRKLLIVPSVSKK